mgnify:FL=1|tara:strand:- start:247 stop:441 length:195 start_codon:yes stop_codon:yes gene_type:complete
MLEIIAGILGMTGFIFLMWGACLLVSDSQKLYNYKKELKQKYPDLNKEQISLIAKMYLEDNEHE